VPASSVALSGGDYTDPLTAMNDVSTWCGTPSATNPCLLKIMPAVYDIGTNSLQMQSYVDIEGSGENTTKIKGNVFGLSGVVYGGNNAEIRFLTVENTGGGDFAIAIYNNSSSPTMTNVTATASGGTQNIGVINNVSASPTMTNVTATASGGTQNIGVINNVSASPTMTNVTATASGGTNNIGVINNVSASPTMTNVTATASGGTNNYGVYNGVSGTVVRIDQSVIRGTTTIRNGPGVTTYVGSTRLDGGTVYNEGTLTCAGVYDENYVFYANTCP